MSSCVIDASALLAHLNDESGADRIGDWLRGGAVISAVNWSEVLSTLADRGLSPQRVAREVAESALLGESLAVESFGANDAVAAAELRPSTRALGLSSTDRACIALGERLGLPVVTTDRVWAEASLPVRVELVR